MIIVDRVELFVNFFNQIKLFNKQEIKDLMDLRRYKQAESKMVLEEYLTLIILYRFSSCKNLKAFWYQEKYFSNNCWPNIPSYHRFIVWINRLEKLLKNLLDNTLSRLNQKLGMIDSTKIETTTIHWRGKIHKNASKGYSCTKTYLKI